MKKLIVLLFSLLVISGCTQQESQVQQLNSNQAFEKANQQQNIIIVDVRTVAEYNEGHIADSINVPLDQLKANIGDSIESKDTPLFVVCRSGNRSAQAQSMLLSMGYTDVTDIGSVFDWPEELKVINP
jgi:rhodanese-related sulfurtransferase